jgi:membrane associated rhomboid family serine protease
MTPSTSDPRRTAIGIVIALVASMWVLEVVDVALDHRLDQYGIEPRDPDGLDGVVAAPFLHVGFGHLIANTIPFVVMGVVIAFEGPLRLLGVTAIVAIVSGLGTWLIAPENTIHLGASGVVFGFATYLIARGWFNRRAGELAMRRRGGGALGRRPAWRPRAAARHFLAGTPVWSARRGSGGLGAVPLSLRGGAVPDLALVAASLVLSWC